MLSEEVLKGTLSASVRNSLLELAALANIADMVPQVADNEIFVEQGLRSLQHTFRPGLRVFLDILGQGEVAAGGYFKIISAINAAESIDFKNQSYELLTSASSKHARQLAEDLIGRIQYKQQRIKEISEEVDRRASQKADEPIVFEGDPAWKLTLAGAVASIVTKKHEKPAFIFKRGDTESCGSVRTFQEEHNSVEAMKTCSDLLMTYGGHPKASGFRVKNENLNQFKQCLINYFKK